MEDDHGVASELTFDVAKPPEGIEFLGLLDGLTGSAGQQSGLFRWKCPVCDLNSQNAMSIVTERSFLATWSCQNCSREVLVRFRARPSTEWIAQHTLAVTGKDLYEWARDESSLDPGMTSQRRSRSSQRLFALTTIPFLLLITFLGASDLGRTGRLLGFTGSSIHQDPRYYADIAGGWIDGSTSEQLRFGRIDLNSRVGTYMRTLPDGKHRQVVCFEILDGIGSGSRLVLRELGGPSSQTAVDPDRSGAILYVPKYGESITRVDTVDGQMIVNTYRRASK